MVFIYYRLQRSAAVKAVNAVLFDIASSGNSSE